MPSQDRTRQHRPAGAPVLHTRYETLSVAIAHADINLTNGIDRTTVTGFMGRPLSCIRGSAGMRGAVEPETLPVSALCVFLGCAAQMDPETALSRSVFPIEYELR